MGYGVARALDWSDLKVFLGVAENGSMSAAAKALKLTQPTVSQKIRDLEATLNCQLFIRSAQGISLTKAGQLIREHALSMERSAQAVDRLVRELDLKDEGRVRLAAPDGMSSFWIAPRLGDFYRVHPRITISLDAGLWPNDPLQEELDLSLQYEPSTAGDMVVQPLATVHYALFASQRYISLYGEPKSLAEIATHRTIHHSGQKQQKDTWDPKLSALQTLWTANLETNCSASVVMAVYSGVGVGLMPTAAASFMPGLVMLSDQPVAAPKLWLVYHSDIAKVARVRRVIEWLKSIYDPKDNPCYRTEFVHPKEFGPIAQAPGALPDLSDK